MRYELKTALYEGPIEKLLELIEDKKLDIAEVSMAQVTDDFLAYLEGVTECYKDERERGEASVAPSEYMRFLADFIVIASRLIFIKSKSLIPDTQLSEEDESQIKDLEERLLWYRELKPAMKNIGAMWRSGNHEFSRPYFLHVKGLLLAIRAQQGEHGIFFYPSGVKIPVLADALKKVLALTDIPVVEERAVQEKIISLEEKIKEVFGRLKFLKETTFRGIANGASKVEAIVAFLAVLHLAREQFVSLEQESRDSDIIIRHSSSNA